jgi:hypothetical protein
MAQAGRVATKLFNMKPSRLATLLLVAVTASFVPAASAAAELTGPYTKFAQCPYENPEASKCIYSTTTGGEVILGSKKVPVANPAVLQGAYGQPDKEGLSKFLGAANGITLSKAAQPVPGGLMGIVPPENASPLVKAALALLFENGLTKVSATLELARPASEIRFNEEHFGGELGAGLMLPIKVHLDNPLLGSSCYVGSSSSPVIWRLTSGTTSPPKPHKPITGTVGKVEFLEEGGFAETEGTTLVDNAWSVPVANGCGGPLSFLIDPIVNSSAGLPSPAGVNTVSLDSAISIASAASVKKNAENH